MCLFVCALRLYPATPDWGVRCGCVCLGWDFGCAPPLLVGVLGCVCVCVRAPLVRRHSWLGCAAWVCVLGLGFRLRPATPGSGVGVCVSFCARSACTLPALAALCGVGGCASCSVGPSYPAGASRAVFAWARVSAAPRHSLLGCSGVCVFLCALRLYPATPGWGVRCGCVCLDSGFGCAPHSWLGCWGVCVFVCALRLYPATPCWAVRCGCVCLGSGFGCAPPLLAGVLGPVCVGARAPLVSRHSWLGCAVWVCLLGLAVRLRPATPGWGVGVYVCLCARSACTPPLLAGVCAVDVFARAQVSAAPRHSLLGCWGVRVPVCALRLHPAYPGWGACCGCVLGLGFRLHPATPGWVAGVCLCLCARSACTPPLLAEVCRVGLCAWARTSAAPRHSWLRCSGVCVFVCALLLYPASPGWGVRCGFVCLCWNFGCALQHLAGLLGSVCVRVHAPSVPCHSWLGCAVLVCVLGLRFWLRPPFFAGVLGCVCVFVCALGLYPATPGWGVRCGCVCLGSGFGCAPPTLAGVLGCVCVCVHAPFVPCHSWLGCVVWVCVLGLGARLRPAIPGLIFGVYVCWCARCACTLPLLAWVCGEGVCAWARFSAVPRHSWLECWHVCVFLCPLCLYPATPGWGVRCGCVCLGSGFGCAPPLLAGVSGCVCVCVRPPLVPRHSWLGCPLLVWVLVLGFRLQPATPGCHVGVCVCLCARSACNPSLLAGVCGVGVCALAPVSAFRPLLAEVLGCVCVFVCAPPVPRHCWLGCAAWMCVLGLGFRLRPATPGWGVGLCVSVCTLCLYLAIPGWGLLCMGGVLPSTCSCAVVRCGFARCPCLRHPAAVVAWHLSVRRGCGRRRASLACLVAPRWCTAPRQVRSLSVLGSAFPTPWCLSPSRGLAPPGSLGGCAGHAEAGQEPGSFCLPLAGPRQRRWARTALYPFGAPRWGCPWRVPPVSVLHCVGCSGLACVDPVTDTSGSRTARLSTGDSAGASELFRVDADTAPFGSEDATPGSRACVRPCAPLGRVGQADRPGAFWCASPFPVAGLTALFVCWAPSGLGLPCLPLLLCLFFFFFHILLCAPVVSGVPCFPGQAALGRGVLLSPRNPPPFFFLFFVFSPPRSLFFFLFSFLLFLCFLFFLLFFSFRSPPPFFLPSVPCRLCGAGVVCVSWAVGCAGGWWLWCLVLCVAVCCVVWCCGLWWVVCFAWCCVACFCWAGFLRLDVRRPVLLGLVVLFLLSAAVACCCELCWFIFRVVPCLSVVLRAVSVCMVLCRGASCCSAWPCRIAFLCWFLLRCAVSCSAVP